MSELLRLAERVEQARGPNRELDVRIKAALFGAVPLVSPFNGEWCLYRPGTTDARIGKSFERPFRVSHESWTSDRYTASLDAAMTLIPSEANSAGEVWRAESYSDPGVIAPHVRASAWVSGAARVYAATPALALTAAALRARAALEGEGKRDG
jgi:hypothetical protein